MFQDFASRQYASPQAEPPRRPAVEEAADLISRYPSLSEIELARLINLYRGFSALDSALIISDRGIGPKLDRFFKDHRSEVRPPFRQYAGLLFYALLTVGAVVWAVIVASGT